jgi:Phage Mu protein F like protein/Acetyltransferase (GNAT) family
MISPAFVATLVTLETALAVLRARTPGTPAGDDDEQHEDNTFGLPEGRPLRRQMKRWYRRQLKTILGSIPTIGSPLPKRFKSLADYNDPMASAMTPLISAYWDEAGKETRARLGLDPDAWEVHDPHLHEVIQSSTLKFCDSTNATTDKELGEALEQLREEFHQGLVSAGETIPELTSRVKGIFSRLSDYGAERIARTEASRAVHAASLISAKESGVVAGKKWLVSANSCDKCHAIAEEANKHGIGLDDDFAHEGSNAGYARIPNPPLHPHCRCSTTYVLTAEYEKLLAEHGPPDPKGWKPGALGPEIKERPDLSRKPKDAALPKFGKTKAKIETEDGRNATLSKARELFGRPISLRELASFSGATESATVRISFLDHGSGPKFFLDVADDKYIANRTIQRDYDDRLYLKANSIHVGEEYRRSGIGREIFGRMVETAVRNDLHRIDTYAVRDPDSNGYFTWPLFGYDGELPRDIRNGLPPPLSHCKLVSDLFATEQGTKWWSTNGQSVSLSFDLESGSLSRQRWEMYLRAKMAREK